MTPLLRPSRGLPLLAALLLASLLALPSASANEPGEITVEAAPGQTPGFSGDYESAVGITTGPDGLIWFTQSFAAVGRRNADGSIDQFTDGLTGDSLTTIVDGPDGNLWFAEFNPPGRIGRITPEGEITEMAVFGVTPGFTSGNVEDIAVGPDGNLWFTKPFNGGLGDPGRVGRITPAGVVTEFVPPNQGAQPRSIVAGPDGRLWYTDSAGSGRIMTITTDGTFDEIAVGGTTPGFSGQQGLGDIVVGPDGAFWFIELLGAVGRITTEGAVTEFDVPDTDNLFGGITSACGDLWLTRTADEGADAAVFQLTTDGDFTELTDGLPDPEMGLHQLTEGPDGDVWFAGYGPGNGEDGVAYLLKVGTECEETPSSTTTTTTGATAATPAAVPAAAPARAVAVTPAFTG